MNVTEFRTVSDIRFQRELERMRAARHEAIAAREARFRRLPLPAPQPEPANFCATNDDDAPPAVTRRQLIAAIVIISALFAGALWLAAHNPAYLSRAVQQALEGAK